MIYDHHLKTECLLLRPLRPSDAGILQNIASDARVALSTASIPHPYPENGAIEFILRSTKSAGRHRRSFAVALKQTDELIGLCGFIATGPVAEIRYLIAPSHWRRGVATEAARALALHLFDQLGFKEITATAMTTNLGSIGVLRKLNFERESDSIINLPLRGGEHVISNWRLKPSAIHVAFRDRVRFDAERDR